MFDSMIKEGLEKEGSLILGVPVRVAAASVSPFSGQAVIEGLTIGVPAAVKVARLAARTSLSSPFDLGEVAADGVDVILELGRGGSNLGRLRRGMGQGTSPLTIRRLVVRNASVGAKLYGRAASFPLPELILDRVDLRGLVEALIAAALGEARKRFWRLRSMPQGRKRLKKA